MVITDLEKEIWNKIAPLEDLWKGHGLTTIAICIQSTQDHGSIFKTYRKYVGNWAKFIRADQILSLHRSDVEARCNIAIASFKQILSEIEPSEKIPFDPDNSPCVNLASDQHRELLVELGHFATISPWQLYISALEHAAKWPDRYPCSVQFAQQCIEFQQLQAERLQDRVSYLFRCFKATLQAHLSETSTEWKVTLLVESAPTETLSHERLCRTSVFRQTYSFKSSAQQGETPG